MSRARRIFSPALSCRSKRSCHIPKRYAGRRGNPSGGRWAYLAACGLAVCGEPPERIREDASVPEVLSLARGLEQYVRREDDRLGLAVGGRGNPDLAGLSALSPLD